MFRLSRSVRHYSSKHPVSHLNTKDVFLDGARITREKLDKHRLGVTDSIIPRTMRPPLKLRRRLHRKWAKRARKNHRLRVSKKGREDARMIRDLREGRFDSLDSLLNYHMLGRNVNVDVYNKILERLALIAHKHDVLGEAVELYEDMITAQEVEPDQFTYYYLVYIAARADHVERAMFFFREYAIRYFVNLEPRNLHASILTALWRLLYKHQDASHALALFRASVQHSFYSPLKGDFYLFEDQQDEKRAFIDSTSVDPELLPSAQFLRKVLLGSEQQQDSLVTLPMDRIMVGTEQDNNLFHEVTSTNTRLNDVTNEGINAFIAKMRDNIDPVFFSDVYSIPNSDSLEQIEQYNDTNFDANRDIMELFKHYLEIPSTFRVGPPLSLQQHQRKRRQQLQAEIEKSEQVDIVGKLKNSATSNWLSSEYRFDDIVEQSYNDFRRRWIDLAKKDPRQILLENGNLHRAASDDMFAAKILERRRHRLTAALFSSERFAEDLPKYQQMYREFRGKATKLLDLHRRGMRWVPVILGRKGEIYIPKSINIFEITDDKIYEAKQEFAASLFPNSPGRQQRYLKRFSHRMRVRWFDIEKREFVKDFFYK